MTPGSKQSRPKAAVSWSSGKDSAYAFQVVQKSGKYDIVALQTTVTTSYGRVSMHGVREKLLLEQSNALGVPVVKIELPAKSTNEIYEEKMKSATQQLRNMGVEFLIFGDLFLQDIRNYRESKLEGTGITPLFPLWGRDTGKLAFEMIDAGIAARIVCLDPRKLDRKFGGALFDRDFLAAIPDSVDPCGENGEFHTFVFEAPFFRRALPVVTGESVERDGFYFTDLDIPS